LAEWFTVTPSVDLGSTVAAGDSVSTTSLDVTAPTIALNDSGTDQDACQNASVGISFTTTGS
jgi:hypothetical protein